MANLTVKLEQLKTFLDQLKLKFVLKEDGKGLSSNDYTASEKDKLSKIEEGANRYVHPSSHPATMITQDISHKFVTDEEKNVWNSKAPSTHKHSALDITQNSTHRFVSDNEKSNWNSKISKDEIDQSLRNYLPISGGALNGTLTINRDVVFSTTTSGIKDSVGANILTKNWNGIKIGNTGTTLNIESSGKLTSNTKPIALEENVVDKITYNNKVKDLDTKINKALTKSAETLPIGSIIEWSSPTPPPNWLVCDGSWISETAYSDLFAIIGHTYDGEETKIGFFKLPNRKGRVAVGLDSADVDFNTLGKQGGEKTHKLSVEEMPKHKHKMVLRLNASVGQYWARPPLTANAGSDLEHDDPVQFSGGDQPHNNIQPYEVSVFIIKYRNDNVYLDDKQAKVVDSLTSTSIHDALSANQGRLLKQQIDNRKEHFHFSTEEQWTGDYWLDGKKIYTTTVPEFTAKGNTNNKYIDALNCDDILDIWIDLQNSYWCTKGSSGIWEYRLLANCSSNLDYICETMIIKTTPHPAVRVNVAPGFKDTNYFKVTVRYTKK